MKPNKDNTTKEDFQVNATQGYNHTNPKQILANQILKSIEKYVMAKKILWNKYMDCSTLEKSVKEIYPFNRVMEEKHGHLNRCRKSFS